MKKLSLILALMLIFTCAALAACGGDEDTSSAASSDASSEASSEASSNVESSDASSEDASSDVDSSDASTEDTSSDVSSDAETSDDTSETPAEKPEIKGENKAKGKKYEISGCGTGYQQYTANLTDGVAATAASYDGNWFAFYCNGDDTSIINAPDKVGTVIIDLGEVTDVSAVRINLVNASSAGVLAPAKVRVSLSEDGKDFGDKVSMPIEDTDGTAYWSEGAIAGSARYVKIQFTLEGVFAFLNEIEVY